jgi:putative transposase
MVTERWKHSNTTVYNLGYHLIWCPKYRRKVLVGEVEEHLRTLLIDKAKEIEVEIIEMEIMPDHVHLFVKGRPTDSPHFIVQQFKGYTSHVLRKEHPELKSRLPTLWTRSYYVESVGHISEQTIRKYIEEQKNQ